MSVRRRPCFPVVNVGLKFLGHNVGITKSHYILTGHKHSNRETQTPPKLSTHSTIIYTWSSIQLSSSLDELLLVSTTLIAFTNCFLGFCSSFHFFNFSSSHAIALTFNPGK